MPYQRNKIIRKGKIVKAATDKLVSGAALVRSANQARVTVTPPAGLRCYCGGLGLLKKPRLKVGYHYQTF
jgi:hypothetical protein